MDVAGSHGSHRHGAPCRQPHWQDEATAAGAWQPQLQLAPTHDVHVQLFSGVFIAMLQMEWQTGLVWVHSGYLRLGDLEQMGCPDSMEAHAGQVESRKRPVVGIGRVIGWPGGSLWIGRHVAPVQDHAHHAIQISLAMEGSFRIQASAWPAARRTRGMVVMPDRRHRFDGCGTAVATLFVEPNSACGAALRERFSGFDIALLADAEAHEAVRHLHARYTAAAPNEVMAQFARGAVGRIAGNPPVAASENPRITAALAWMSGRLTTSMRLAEVAATVHLSPSRFRHLFVSQTGTSMRAWLLWARVAHAVEYAFQGHSWTEAAHEAGFADAAHLTRTCRRMFGLAPTMLVPEQVDRSRARG